MEGLALELHGICTFFLPHHYEPEPLVQPARRVGFEYAEPDCSARVPCLADETLKQHCADASALPRWDELKLEKLPLQPVAWSFEQPNGLTLDLNDLCRLVCGKDTAYELCLCGRFTVRDLMRHHRLATQLHQECHVIGRRSA